MCTLWTTKIRCYQTTGRSIYCYLNRLTHTHTHTHSALTHVNIRNYSTLTRVELTYLDISADCLMPTHTHTHEHTHIYTYIHRQTSTYTLNLYSLSSYQELTSTLLNIFFSFYFESNFSDFSMNVHLRSANQRALKRRHVG